MSFVTTVILITAWDEDDGVAELNRRMAVYAYNVYRPFVAVEATHCAGGKNLECAVHLGSFNGIQEGLFLDLIGTAQWSQPECVQVFFRKEIEEKFREGLR